MHESDLRFSRAQGLSEDLVLLKIVYKETVDLHGCRGNTLVVTKRLAAEHYKRHAFRFMTSLWKHAELFSEQIGTVCIIFRMIRNLLELVTRIIRKKWCARL